MKQRGFAWCPHCGKPHDLRLTLCPHTGLGLERAVNRLEGKRHSLIDTVIDNRYRILRVIGSGGRGIVFEAENLAMRRLVALKIGHDSDRWEDFERLSREAQIISSLHHPNICDIYDFAWLPSHGPYLVTERLDGETLAVRSQRTRKLPLREVVDVVTQMLCGLQAAHVRNVIHRDLKPRNVFLVDRINCSPVVKLMDFGLAKDLQLDERRAITKPGVALGTPQYMSPEQLSGDPVSAASDIFSVGVIAYELLAGDHPFTASTIIDLQLRILEDLPTPLGVARPDLSPRVDAVLRRALEKNPRERYSNAISFQSALLDLVQSHHRHSNEQEPSSDASSLR